MIGKISTPQEHVEPSFITCSVLAATRNIPIPTYSRAGVTQPSLEPPLRPDGKRDFTKLVGLLLQPQAALGKRAYARPVCTARCEPHPKTGCSATTNGPPSRTR